MPIIKYSIILTDQRKKNQYKTYERSNIAVSNQAKI